MNDDYSQNPSTTGVLTVGGSTTGNLEWYYDEDWFRISLEAGKTYLFNFSGTYQGGGTLRDVSSVDFYLYDANGNMIDGLLGSYSGNMLQPPVLQFVPQTAGTYFLGAGTYDLKGTGSYTISASLQAPDDFPSDIGTSGVLPGGGQAHGNYEVYGDRDWFKFHAEVGQHYTFRSKMDDPAAASYSTIRLYDSHGAIVNGGGSLFEPLATGDYYVAAEGLAVGAYTLTAGTVVDDYARNSSTTGVLATGSHISGKIDYAYDVDRFKLSLQTGVTYTFVLTGDPTEQARLDVRFDGDAGNPVTVTGYRDTDGALHKNVTVTTSGDYYVDVRTVEDYYAYVPHGAYTLTSLDTLSDDYGNTMATAGNLVLGSQVSANLQWGADVDMFKVDLQAGVTYAFELLAGAGMVNPLSLMLSSATGAALGTAQWGEQKFYTFTPLASGSYYASVQQAGATGGAYTIKASQAPDDVGASAGLAGNLALGGTVDAALQSGGGDRDWYGVSLAADTTYVVSLSTIKLPEQYGRGGQIKVLDGGGAVIASLTGDDYTTAQLSFASHAAGTYFVEVSSPSRSVGNYQLGIQSGQHDDYGNDIAGAQAISVGATLQGRLEVTTDHDVFKLSTVAGHRYVIDASGLAGADSTWSSGVTLEVSRPGEQFVRFDTKGNSLTEIYGVLDATVTGDYYITLRGSNFSGPRDYQLATSAVAGDDYEDATTTTGVLAANSSVRGAIELRADKDWIKVHLDSGNTYVFDLHGSASGGGTLDASGSGGELNLFNASGLPTQVIHGYTTEPQIKYTATTTGDYYVQVQGNWDRTGSYTLTSSSTVTDVTAPALAGIAPSSGSSNVGLQDNIVLTFSEPIKIGSGTVRLLDANGVSVATVTTDGHLQVSGNTLTIDAVLPLKPGATYTVEVPQGSLLDLAGNPYAGLSHYSFTTAPAENHGSAGNDILVGTLKGELIDGGAGVDTVSYNGRYSDYRVVADHDHYTIQKTGSAAVDTLIGVERLMFDNASVALDTNGSGGQAYRLYQAAFNRTPDQGGLGYWMNAMDHGLRLNDAASNFIVSAEFKQLYGATPSDAEYVNQLYHNVLHRDGEAGGTAYWLKALQGGGSRAEVLASFSESQENQAALIGVIGHGFEYVPYGGPP